MKNSFGYSENIPEKIRDIFMWLCQDVASLNQKWGFWLEVFGKQENVDLIPEAAPASFNIILEILQNDIVMSICRLSDPEKSMGKENLSFATLANRCPEHEDIHNMVNEFQKICEPVKQRRNKKIGHRDLKSTISASDNPLQNITKEQINNIVRKVENILNFTRHKYENVELYFHPVLPGGPEELIFWLHRGKTCNKDD